MLLAVCGVAAASSVSAKPADPCAGHTLDECVKLATGFEYGVDRQGHKVKRDAKRAAAMYQAACEGKHAGACIDLAEMGSRAGLDDAGVRRWYGAACDLGDDVGCFLLGSHLKESDAAADRAAARTIFEKLCKVGRGEACFALGDMSPLGRAQVGWYRKACDAGEDRGCAMLERIYFEGEDPDADAVASTRALEKRCDAGSSSACTFAALRHSLGRGARKSQADANVWMIKACEHGDLHVCVALGRSIVMGDKDIGDRALAVRLLSIACDGGEADACEWRERAKAARPR